MLGRFLCRLFGDNAGQGLMEYVVIAVLVVAAAVGAIMIFGGNLKTQIQIAYYSMIGNTERAAELRRTLEADLPNQETEEEGNRRGITTGK